VKRVLEVVSVTAEGHGLRVTPRAVGCSTFASWKQQAHGLLLSILLGLPFVTLSLTPLLTPTLTTSLCRRLACDPTGSWVLNVRKLEAAGTWAAAVDSLRAAAEGQWALLGALGEERQQQQWQQQQREGDGDRETAEARAVYLLLLLRLLGPITMPSIRYGARVVVLR
jgi:hypothetical protein